MDINSKGSVVRTVIIDAFVKALYNFLLSETNICCYWSVSLSLKTAVVINGIECIIEFRPYILGCDRSLFTLAFSSNEN